MNVREKPAGTRTTDRRRARKQNSSGVTLADVATLAGVSTASVSRALNAPETVSLEIRSRVLSATSQLRWIPNGAAKALASTRTGTVGALIPSLWHLNFANVIESLQAKLSDAGYTLLLGFSAYSEERELQQARKMIERGVECVVLIGEDHSPALYQTLRERNIPYIITYTTGRDPKNVCVGFDNYEAYYQIVKYLLDLGHRRFALIAQPTTNNDRVRQRVDATRDALAAHGIAIRPQHSIQVDQWTINDGRQALRKIWDASEHRPTAVLCTNDYFSAGAIFEARSLGIRIPQELSISGFDDIELAQNTEPPLTTVHVPDFEMGREVADYIIELTSGKNPPTPRKLTADLVIRGSTGAPES
jgi:LacI family transcriptional regulator